MEQATLTPPASKENNAAEVTKPDFGKGRYSEQMERYYQLMQSMFGISSGAAEKIARQMSSDFGAVEARMKTEMGVSKLNKDGKANFKLIGGCKGVTSTSPMNIAHAIQWAEEAGKHHISYGFTTWKFNDALAAYVADVEREVAKAAAAK